MDLIEEGESEIPINVSVNIPFLNFLIDLNFNHKFQAWALIGHLRGCGQVQRMCWLFVDYVTAGHCASLCCCGKRKASVCCIWRAKVGHTLPLPASFPVCPGTAGRFWPAITQKDKTSSTKPHSAANITTMIQMINDLHKNNNTYIFKERQNTFQPTCHHTHTIN